MRKVGLAVAASVAAAATTLGVAGPAAAAGERARAVPLSYRLTAQLGVAQEVPKPRGTKGGAGLFSATMDVNGKTGSFAWRLAFRNLTGAAVAAHVHIGPPGKAGPVAIPLCGPCRSGAHGTLAGPIAASPTLLQAILHGDAYVNVHTAKNSNGEIRGQIRAARAVPVPAGKTATVDAREIDFGIRLSRSSAPAGPVEFVVRDAGKLAHQFIVVRTKLAPNRLPVKGTGVVIGAAAGVIELGKLSLQPGGAGHLTLNLVPGRYVLLCNLPGHYKAGQYAGFQVGP